MVKNVFDEDDVRGQNHSQIKIWTFGSHTGAIKKKSITQCNFWIQTKKCAFILRWMCYMIWYTIAFHFMRFTSNSGTSAGRVNAFVRERVCRIFHKFYFLYHLWFVQFGTLHSGCKSILNVDFLFVWLTCCFAYASASMLQNNHAIDFTLDHHHNFTFALLCLTNCRKSIN